LRVAKPLILSVVLRLVTGKKVANLEIIKFINQNMATYDELMVYKHAYDLTVQMMQLTKKMERGFKFTLGERINASCVEMLIAVYRINKASADR
jgi:hypothetical protein